MYARYAAGVTRSPLPAAPDVQVSVDVQYLAQHSGPGRALFTYLIRIENRSGDTWQLRARHWDIVDATGRETQVDGEGVVGEQPHIPPGGSYTYDSFVTVEAAPARMSGYYLLQDAWGAQAQAPIPAFILGVPGSRVLN